MHTQKIIDGLNLEAGVKKYHDENGRPYRFILFKEFSSVEETNNFWTEEEHVAIRGNVISLHEVKVLRDWYRFFELKETSDCLIFYCGHLYARLPGEKRVYQMNVFHPDYAPKKNKEN